MSTKIGTPLLKALLLEHRLPWRYKQSSMYRKIRRLLTGILYNVKVFNIKFKKKKTMVVLFTYKDIHRNPNSFKDLIKLLKGISGFKITIIHVDNSNEAKRAQKMKYGAFDVWYIGGDNSFWQFSGGFKKGSEFLRENKMEFDLILYANEAFLNMVESTKMDVNFYKSRINTLSLYALKENEVLCQVNFHKNSVETFLNYDVSIWIRIHLLVFHQSIFTKLNFIFINDKTITDICTDEFSKEIFKKNNLLSHDLKKCLTSWLTGRWFKESGMTKEEWNMLKSKIKDLLNERMFFHELKKHNAKLINYCAPETYREY